MCVYGDLGLGFLGPVDGDWVYDGFGMGFLLNSCKEWWVKAAGNYRLEDCMRWRMPLLATAY